MTQLPVNLVRDGHAADQLLPVVYEELRRLAAERLAQERPGQTLQATALVHEAWLRLVSDGEKTWQNRAHFFGAAAEAMRRILIESARRKSRLKHGGGQERLNVEDLELAETTPDEKVLLINESLEIARRYAAPESIHFLNGVLDAIARGVLKQRLS